MSGSSMDWRHFWSLSRSSSESASSGASSSSGTRFLSPKLRPSSSALASATPYTTGDSRLEAVERAKKKAPVLASMIYLTAIGGVASCIAEISSYPFDYAKTRLQLQTSVGVNLKVLPSSLAPRFHGMLDVLLRAPKLSSRGIMTLYDGLKPALLRQASYGTVKIVIYEKVKHELERLEVAQTARQLLAGALAGAMSSAICNPTDLIKVRMAGGDRKEYTTITQALRMIIKEEGFLGLYKGVAPTTQRAMVVTLLNLPTYDIAKYLMIDNGYTDGFLTHFISSLISGFLSTYGSNPIDTVKSRIMNQPIDPKTGLGLLYSNSLDCAIKTIRDEGALALWKGSVPNCCRNVPWLVIFWCSYEALKKAIQPAAPAN